MGGLSAMFLLSFLQYTSSNFQFALCVHRFLNSILDPCCHSFSSSEAENTFLEEHLSTLTPWQIALHKSRSSMNSCKKKQTLSTWKNTLKKTCLPVKGSGIRLGERIPKTAIRMKPYYWSIHLLYHMDPFGSILSNILTNIFCLRMDYLPCLYKMVDLEVKQYREIWIRTIM